MPIYEYVCPKCNSEFELLVRSNEKSVCPSCGSTKLNRQMSVPAAHSNSDQPGCPGRSESCHSNPLPCCGS
ncbi:MAG: FmdB family zinc ribbon protein, partial [Thermoguttaceae bacterium]